MKYIDKSDDICQQITYTEVDLYITALSNRRAPRGPVRSGFMTCFISEHRSYRTAFSCVPTPSDSKYRA